jgi:hypothetical protein
LTIAQPCSQNNIFHSEEFQFCITPSICSLKSWWITAK